MHKKTMRECLCTRWCRTERPATRPIAGAARCGERLYKSSEVQGFVTIMSFARLIPLELNREGNSNPLHSAQFTAHLVCKYSE